MCHGRRPGAGYRHRLGRRARHLCAGGRARRRPGLRGANPLRAHAGPGRRGAAATGQRLVGLGQPDGDDPGAGLRRAALRRRRPRPVRARRRAVPGGVRRRPGDPAGPPGGCAGAGDAALRTVRPALHLDPSGRVGRHLARPVRGAAGRRHGAAADLRARHPAHRRLGAGRAACRTGGGRADDVGPAGTPAAAPPRRPADVRRRGGVRPGHGRVRRVPLPAPLPWSPSPCWVRRTWSAW